MQIAVRNGDTELLEKVEGVFTMAIADGIYDKLLKKYF